MNSASNICVAVIDDDDSIRCSLSRLLRVSGIHPVTYHSAEAFLMDGRRSQFDCLVLDIQLSGMSGIELCECLGALGSTTPVIFNTVFDEPNIRDRAMRSGCAAYLRKNGSGHAVLAAIERVVNPISLERGE